MAENKTPDDDGGAGGLGNLADRATELRNQAVAAAGPLAETAKERAARAAAAAKPMAADAKERALKAAGEAAPKARQGMNALAGNLDKRTGGKYSSRIRSVTGLLGKGLDSIEKRSQHDDPEPPAQA